MVQIETCWQLFGSLSGYIHSILYSVWFLEQNKKTIDQFIAFDKNSYQRITFYVMHELNASWNKTSKIHETLS